jgi:pimeloyl-ACP methyl ester carboxylesterase
MPVWKSLPRKHLFLIIPDAGHAPNIDQPEVFNKAVLEFLARV